jgi:hypothetical protein
MEIIKSSSALVAFTEAGRYSNQDKFKFLHFIQSLSLDVNTNRINSKFIGDSKYLKDQLVEPDINLNITFLNTKDFFNEAIIGFDLRNSKLFENLVHNEIFNKHSLILLNDIGYVELLNTGLENSKKYISLENLYLQNYSLSYKVNSLPVASADFIGNNFKIGNVDPVFDENNKIIDFTLIDWNGVSRSVSDTTFSEFKLDTEKKSDRLVFLMNGISAASTMDDTYVPGVSFSSFLNSAINSFDMSIEFNRKKFYFFNQTNFPASRKIILPINGSLKLSGTSVDLTVGDLKTFFSKNEKFTIDMSILDNGTLASKLYLNNITIESYSYSININGFLEYELSCFFHPYDDFQIEIKDFTLPSSDLELESQDSQIIQSSDGFSF